MRTGGEKPTSFKRVRAGSTAAGCVKDGWFADCSSRARVPAAVIGRKTFFAFVVILLALMVPTAVFGSSQESTVTLAPTSCLGWENAQAAVKFDEVRSAQFEDFDTKRSAMYSHTPTAFGQIGSLAGAPSIACGGFAVTKLPESGEITAATVVLSLAARAGDASADVLVVETSSDGTTWEAIGAIPLQGGVSNAIHDGYWRFPLTPALSAEALAALRIRVRFNTDGDFVPVTVFLDGIAVEVNVRKEPKQPFLRTFFAMNEQPIIVFNERSLEEIEILDSDGNVVDLPQVTQVVDGKLRITFERGALLKPGTYIVRSKSKKLFRSVVQEQRFSYGLANINTAKSIYAPGDLVSLTIGVLDNRGRTICDASLTLRVTKPNGQTVVLNTGQGSILGSAECGPESLTNQPDYSAHLIAEEAGRYETALDIKTDRGIETGTGSFTISEEPQPVIERLAPTRINPKASYFTRLRITPSADFTGRVEERVPKGFTVDKLQPLAVVSDGGETQTIAWEVVWEKGKTYELSYAFNAPDISPTLFTMGPLVIGDFAEPRPWTLSSDEVVRKEEADVSYEALQVTDEDFAPKKNKLVETTKQAFTADENAQIKVFKKGYDVPDADKPSTLPKDKPLSVIKVEVKGPNPEADKGIARVSEVFEKNGQQVEFIHLVPTKKFRQGVYTISITYSTDTDSVVETKTFAWGVLVINTPKSVYHPGEQVQFGMGLVNEGGHTLCDAPLTLIVTPPGGEAPVTFTTEDGSIQYSKECGPTTVTNVPDYGATYTAGAAGDYALALTGTIQGVPYTIHDTLSVRDGIPFALTRDAPTRLFPGANYNLSLTVIPEQDYQGDVVEYVPATYSVVSVGQGGNAEPVDDDKQRIRWTVDWQTGTTNMLTYTFDPEDISPALFRLGPATIGDFAEYRQWMIASDAVCTAFATGNWSAAGTWTGGGCTGPGGIPGTADTVVIPTSVIVTVDTGNPSVVSLTLNNPSGGANGVTIATGQTLTLTGAGTALSYTANATSFTQTITMQGTGNLTVSTGNVVVNAPTGKGGSFVTCAASATGTFSIAGTLGITGNSTNTGLATFDMLTCRLTVTGLTTLTGGSDATGKAGITASTGTVDTNGGLTFAGTAGNALFSTSGIATWNNIGTISGGSAASFSFTARTLLKFTGTSAINTAYTSLPDVEVVSGTTTLGAAQTVTGLMVDSGATLAGSTFLLTNTCTGTGTAGFRIDGTYSGSGGVTINTATCTIDAQGAGAKLVSNTGTFTVSANATIASTANITIGSGAATAPFTVTAGTVTNNGTVTLANTGTGAGLTGVGGWTNAATGTLNTAGATTTAISITTLTATANGNTVNYNGAAQTCKVTSYWHLQLNGSGAKTCAPTSPIAGNVTVGGTATWTQTATETISGNLTISGGTLTTAAFAFTVTGTTSISSGTLTLDNNTGSKTLTGLATTTGGTLNGSSTAIVLGAGVTNTTGTVQLYGNVTMSTLNGALTATTAMEIVTLAMDTAAAFTISGAGGLLVWGSYWINSPAVVTNTAPLELRGALNGTGTFINGAGGTLKIKFDAAPAITTLTATANPNTVDYMRAGTQTVRAITYHHLTLSGSGVKTLTSLATVNGDFTLSGTASATLVSAVTVGGNLLVGDGASAASLTTGAFTFGVTGNVTIANLSSLIGNASTVLSVGGNWLRNATGVFTHNSAAVKFTSTSGTKTINTGGSNFYNVTFDGSGGTWNPTTNSMTVANDLTMTNGLLQGSGALNITVNGHVACGATCGTITTSNGTGTFTQSVAADKNFGTSVAADTTNWSFYNLTFTASPASTITTSTTPTSPGTVTVTALLTISNADTRLNVGNRTWVLSGNAGTTLTLTGILSGTGRLTYQNSATTFPTGGTLSDLITRFDTVNGNMVIPARTDYGAIEAYGGSANARTVTLGTAGSQTITTSSYLYVIADAASPNHVTLQGATWDPTLNIGGDLDFTGTGSANEIITAPDAAATWTVSGNVNFTDGTYTKSAETLVMNGTAKTLTSGGQTLNNLTLSGSITLANFGHTIAGNLSMAGGTITAGTSIVTMTGTSNTLTGGGNTLNTLNIDPSSVGTITLQTSDLTVSSQLTVAASDALTLDVSRILTISSTSSIILIGTINGPGRLTYQSVFAFPTTGTLAATLITRFDTVNGNMVIPARTDYGAIEAYGGSANARTVTLGTAGSQTITTSSYLYVIADAASTNHVTLQGATWDPTLNIGGDLDFTGTGSANEIVTAPDAAATWTVSGNVNFTDGTYTKSAETLVMNAGIAKTLTSAGQTLNNLTLSGSIILANATHTIAGNLSMAGGTITAGTSTVTMTGTSNTITGGGNTLANLTVDPATAGTITASTSNLTVSAALSVAASDTLSIASGITITWTGSSFTLTGTISGAGRLTVNSSTTIPTTGALSSIVRFDLTSGLTTTAPARTYGGDVEAFSSSNTASYLLIVGAGTHTISGSLLVLANGIGGVTYDGTFNNPTVTVAGNVDFTGTGSGTEGIATGTGTWTVTGNVDFTDGGLTASTGNVFLMDGTANLIGSGQSFYDLTVNGSGTTVTVTTSDVTVTNTLTLGAAADVNNDTLTIASGRTLTLSGNAGTTLNITNSGTDTINGPGKLTYRNSAATFPTVGTLAAALIVRFDTVNGAMIIPARTDYGAIEAYGGSANARTLTLGTAGSQTITLSSYLYVIADAASPNHVTLQGATWDPTLNVGGDFDFTGTGLANEIVTAPDAATIWTVSGNVNFTDGTYTKSAETLAMNGTSKSLTSASQSLNNFTVSGGTVSSADTLDVDNDLTISGGTYTAPTTLTIGGSFDNDAAFTHNSGTVTFNASTGTKTIDADGTGAEALNHVVFNDSAGTAVWQLTTLMDVDGNFTITGGEVQAQTNTINLAGNWSNSDLFTEGSSTVIFDAGVAGQTITTGNTVTNGGGVAIAETTGRGFYHVTVSTTGGGEAILAASSDLSVDGTFTMSSGSAFDIGSNDNKIIVKGDLDLSAVADPAFDARESTYSDYPQIQLWGAATQRVKIQNTGAQTFDSIQFGDVGQATQTRYLSTGVTSGTLNFQDYLVILSGTVDTKDGANAAVAVTGAGSAPAFYVGDTYGEDSASPKVFNANGSTISTKELYVTDGQSGANSSTFNAMTATITVTDLIRVGDSASGTQVDNLFDSGVTSANTISANRIEVQVGTFELGDSRVYDIGRAAAQGYGIRIYTAGVWDANTNTSDASITVAGDFIVDTSGTYQASNTTVTLDGTVAQKIDPDMDVTFNNLTLDDAGNRTVTFADFDSSSRRITVSGTFTWDGTVAANAVDLAIGSTTFTAILDLTNATAANSAMVIPSSRTLTMITTSSIELAGNWTNNGTFTAASSTVTAEGSNQQTFSGTMTGASQFNALTVTNASGSDPESSPSVIFSAAATTAGTFTAATANTKLRFNAGSTYIFQTIVFNGQATGTRVFLRSSTQGTQWNLNVAGTRSVSNTNVRDSNACGQAPTIDATDGTNVDAGNNSCWDMNTITFTISDTTIGFGALSASAATWANGAATGSATDVAAFSMTLATNAQSGYAITYNGATLTSGSNTINVAAITDSASGTAGTEQFASGYSTDGNATIATGYDHNVTPTLRDWTWVASTTTTVVSETVPTATETISAFYLGNIATTTEAGSYSTTVTYIASGTF